jgi:hypothetical protein
MMKILAAIGLGSALMLAPVVAFADDAAPAAAPDAKMAPAPMAMVHHHHHHHHPMMMKPKHHHHMHPMMHHPMHPMMHHPMAKKPMMKKQVEAPKS